MTTNPKDGPLNIAVMRISRCRGNTKNADRKTEESGLKRATKSPTTVTQGELKDTTKAIKKRTPAKKNDVSS